MTRYSLKELRVLNTRPFHEAAALNQAILAAGGAPLSCPAIEIVMPQKPWLPTLPNLSTFQQAIFISKNAVRFCCEALKQHHIDWPKHILVTAIGQATAKALGCYGIIAHQVPAIAASEQLVLQDTFQQINQQSILLIKGENGRTHIADILRKRGADLFELAVYRRVLPAYDKKQLQTCWQENAVDIILFTSAESIHNIFSMFDNAAHSWLQQVPCLVISERLAKIAAEFGMQKIIVSSPDTMLETLHQFNKGLRNVRK